MRNRSLVVILTSTLIGVGARTSVATPVAGLPQPTIDVNGSAIPLGTLGCTNPDGNPNGPLACNGSSFTGSGFTLSDWTFLLNPDPSITANFTLTNISSIIQTFTLTFTLPIASVGPNISIQGSAAGTLTDLNANSATATDAGVSLYSAMVNGTVLKTLLDPTKVYFAPADPLGGPSSVPVGPENYGPLALGQSADTNMAIRWKFTLTPGDSLQMSGVFDVQPVVPEPGTLLLFGSGLVGLVAFRRRA